MNEQVTAHGVPDRQTDAAFQQLRQRFMEGRITLSELEEQLGSLYAARSSRRPQDLAALDPLSVATPGRGTAAVPLVYPPATEARGHVLSYVMVMAMLIGIWAMSGMGYFWPIWPMMGWGIGVASHVLGIRGGCSPHNRNRGRQVRPYSGRELR